MSKLSGAMLAAKLYERWAWREIASEGIAFDNAKWLANCALDAAAAFIEEASKRDFDTARPTHPGLPVDDGIPHDELASVTP